MDDKELHVVTGAFSYTGKYITRRLLRAGVQVRTLTGHPARPNEFGKTVDVRPLSFDDHGALKASLRGAAVLYNTYWIRFEHRKETFERAVANTQLLLTAAREAGVRRVVHVSIANADRRPDLPYYRGKAAIERFLAASSTSHAILRPTVIFGEEDILINNIAWILRRSPVFGVPGDGQYGIRPIFVDDMAQLAVDLGGRAENVTIDAVGPETFTFDEWLRLLAKAVGSRPRLLHLPPSIALWAARAISVAVRDVVLTADEVKGLTAGLLTTSTPSVGETRLTDWLSQNADTVGRRYASELARHYRYPSSSRSPTP